MIPSPRSLGVEHDHWRPNQYATIDWARKTNNNLIIQAPTGSGKSAVAAALGKYGVVRTLTHTINLQQQYEAQYGFDPLYGMAHYPCEFLGDEFMADTCLFSEGMYECPLSDVCSYLTRRKLVSESSRQALSYAYFLNAIWVKEYQSRYLYCDEAHLLPQMVRSYTTIEYTPKQLQYDDIEHYPMLKTNNVKLRVIAAAKWLEKVVIRLQDKHRRLTSIPVWRRKKNPKINRKIKILGQEIYKVNRVIQWAAQHPEFFYVEFDKDRFKMMPLTARVDFPLLFTHKWQHKLILTSATIGNPATLAKELGLNTFAFRDVPSNFPPKAMPVHTFSDAPALGYRTSKAGWDHWGDLIHKTIRRLNPHWSGLIHVASKRQAHSLATHLANKGLQDRVYIPEGKTTGDKIRRWEDRLKKYPNTLAVAYSFHMGLDAPQCNINIIGKIPFKTLDSFGLAELKFDEDLYTWNAAVLTEQAAGRIRRGVATHYEEDNKKMRKFVAVADGNLYRVEDQLSSHFKDCLTTYT